MSIQPWDVLGIHSVTKTFKKPKDIIELAMVNGAGEILFHEYFDPPRKKRRIENNVIETQSASTSTTSSIQDHMDTLTGIIKDAKIIAAYPDYFHIAALEQSGFEITSFCKRTVNIARIFADNFIEPDLLDKFWIDDEGEFHKRKLGTHPSYVTMFDAVLEFPQLLSTLGQGSARDAVWGAAASAFLFVEMSKNGTRGTTKLPIAHSGEYELIDATERYTQKYIPENSRINLDSCISSLLVETQKLGLDYVDKRQSNGCFWVIGNLDISAQMAVLKEKGFSFHYKPEGGKATKGLPAWWFK